METNLIKSYIATDKNNTAFCLDETLNPKIVEQNLFAWVNNKRRLNIKTLSNENLKQYFAVARKNKYAVIRNMLMDELENRGVDYSDADKYLSPLDRTFASDEYDYASEDTLDPWPNSEEYQELLNKGLLSPVDYETIDMRPKES